MRQKKLEAEFLDLRLPGKTVALIRAWGQRLGLSAEGCARILLLQKVMELLPSDISDVEEDSDVKRETLATDVDQGEQSLTLWRSRLESIGIHSDQLPAPDAVNGTTRVYRRDAFSWPEGAVPSYDYAHIDGQGNIGVSRQAP